MTKATRTRDARVWPLVAIVASFGAGVFVDGWLRTHGPPQYVGHLGGRDSRRQHERQVALHRRLQRQRPVRDQAPLGGGQAHLEPKQGSGPHWGVRLQGTGPPHRLPTPFHRLPANSPTRCRAYVARRRCDGYR